MNILDRKNTNEFYYLIGMIATDGCVVWKNKTKSANDNRCSISQHTRNLYLLEKIKDIFGGNVYIEHKRPSALWRTTDVEFINYLRDIGFNKNKTFTLDISKWFNSLSEIHKKYFIWGVIDGDGNIFFDKKHHKNHKISVVSASLKFITMLSEYFNNAKIYKQNRHNILQCYKLCFNSSNAIKMCDSIYSLPTIKLYVKYKHQAYKQIKEYYNTSINNRSKKWHNSVSNIKKENWKNNIRNGILRKQIAVCFYNIKTNEKVICKPYEFIQRYNLEYSVVRSLINRNYGKNNIYKKEWTVI